MSLGLGHPRGGPQRLVPSEQLDLAMPDSVASLSVIARLGPRPHTPHVEAGTSGPDVGSPQ
jgi:hypothetical protein